MVRQATVQISRPPIRNPGGGIRTASHSVCRAHRYKNISTKHVLLILSKGGALIRAKRKLAALRIREDFGLLDSYYPSKLLTRVYQYSVKILSTDFL